MRINTLKCLFYFATSVSFARAFSLLENGSIRQLRRQILLMAPTQSEDFTSKDDRIANVPRRLFLLSTASSLLGSALFTLNVPSSQASEVRGPVELLRPATRIKLYIDDAIAICLEILKQEANNGIAATTASPKETLQPLAEFLLNNAPTNFITPDEEKLSKRYLEIDTSTAWQARRLKEREMRGAELGIDYTT